MQHDDTQAKDAVHGGKQDKPEKKVEVTVDQKERKVRPGSYTVSDFKREVKVDDALALDQLVNGTLTALDDGQTIDIRGGEVFVSHVRQGGSS